MCVCIKHVAALWSRATKVKAQGYGAECDTSSHDLLRKTCNVELVSLRFHLQIRRHIVRRSSSSSSSK